MITRKQVNYAKNVLVQAYAIGDLELAGRATELLRQWLEQQGIPEGGQNVRLRNSKAEKAASEERVQASAADAPAALSHVDVGKIPA